jgi:hypothetical protein
VPQQTTLVGINIQMCYIRLENLHKNRDAKNHHSHILKHMSICAYIILRHHSFIEGNILFTTYFNIVYGIVPESGTRSLAKTGCPGETWRLLNNSLAVFLVVCSPAK